MGLSLLALGLAELDTELLSLWSGLWVGPVWFAPELSPLVALPLRRVPRVPENKLLPLLLVDPPGFWVGWVIEPIFLRLLLLVLLLFIELVSSRVLF